MRDQSREKPYCNYGHQHVRADLYAKNLADEKNRVKHLEAVVASLEAELDSRPKRLGRDSADLLVTLAAAMQTGETFATPTVSGQSDDPQVHTGKPGWREPHGGHRGARATLDLLHSKIREALDVFESRQMNDWQSPRYNMAQPKQCEWCGNDFTPTRSDARFCSDRCRKNNSRDINRDSLESHDLEESA